MNTILFSDVHLDVAPGGKDTMTVFTQFLRQIDPQEYPRIVIVGDLFDFWFEYKQVIFSGYFDVIRALADLKDAGAETHFAVGNHDFWAGRFLEQNLGFTIHDGAFELDFGGMKAHLVHGDGINPRDRSYRIYKRFARWRPIVSAFRLIHPDWAMAIAQGVSKSSRHVFQSEDLSEGSEVAPQRAYADRKIKSGEAQIVVCGHSHYPAIETIESHHGDGLYINAGDWIYHRTYVTWDGRAFTLRSFNPEGEDVVEAEKVTQPNPAQEADQRDQNPKQAHPVAPDV